MTFTRIQKEDVIKKLKKSIAELQIIQEILLRKKPSHSFLMTVIGNAVSSMVELLIYLENKNPYYKEFKEEFYNNRQASMHRTFFGDLHVAIEEGLRKIILENGLEITNNKYEQAKNIVKKITIKLVKIEIISQELKEIVELVSNRPTFNDYLNAVLNSKKTLSNTYKKECRTYFDGLNIIRNKVSHSDMSLTEEEINKLKKAKLGNAVSKDNLLQMTFEGYKLLIGDVIRFFDRLYANR